MSNPPQAITPSKKRKAAELLDIASNLGHKTGTRLEVKWTISSDDEAADNNNGGGKSISVWWAATLRPRTNETHTLTPEEKDEVEIDEKDVTLPVYELDYDPLPELDFTERSIEQVAFVSDKTLLNLSSEEIMIYRLEGGPSPPPSPGQSDDEEDRLMNREGLADLMDHIVTKTMNNAGLKTKMRGLPMDKQQLIADRVKAVKDQLYERLMTEMERVSGEGGERVIDGDVVRRCLGDLKQGRSLDMDMDANATS
jgi:hypothetical protein